jgi:hypothetical protein
VLRATRASPLRLAAADKDCKETYGAALQQFDELLLAASTVSPISRPLPLYYAVLEAGKARLRRLRPGPWFLIEVSSLVSSVSHNQSGDVRSRVN